MFRLQSVQGKNRLRNVHTKLSSYEMFRIQNVRLRDKCYELWLRNVQVTTCVATSRYGALFSIKSISPNSLKMLESNKSPWNAKEM